MSYLASMQFLTEKTEPFPYNVKSVLYREPIDLSNKITFFIGDNGSGKSTLIEALAYRLQLPHMDGSTYAKSSFDAAKLLQSCLEVNYNIQRAIGFFFRAEDFGDLINSVDRRNFVLHEQLNSLVGEVPDKVIEEMKNNANTQLHHMRKRFGQDLRSYSHGEAYLKIIHEKVKSRGIYILDEPEAALSPAKQLSLIYHIVQHLEEFDSQFIIATHSPMIMAIPGATIYEIGEHGMQATALEDTEHYTITKSFLNNPEMYLRHLR